MGHVFDAMRRKQGEAPVGPAPAPAAAPSGPSPLLAAPVAVAAAASDVAEQCSRALVACCDKGGKVSEQYRALRTQLLAHSQDKPFALAVTSAQAQEGKTVTCLNLAFTLGSLQEGRTLVVDCDFRGHGAAKMLGLPNEPGLMDVLRERCTMEQAVRPTSCQNVRLLPAGMADTHDVLELLGRPEMEELVRRLRADNEYVLFDTPSINSLAAGGVLCRLVGEALLVVRMNKTRRDAVHAAVERLTNLDVTVAGIVLTHRKYYIPGYLYRCS